MNENKDLENNSQEVVGDTTVKHREEISNEDKRLLSTLKILLYVLTGVTILKNILVVVFCNDVDSIVKGKKSALMTNGEGLYVKLDGQVTLIAILIYVVLFLYVVTSFYLYRANARKLGFVNSKIKLFTNTAAISAISCMLSLVFVDINFLSTYKLAEWLVLGNVSRTLIVGVIFLVVNIGIIYVLISRTKEMFYNEGK